MLNRIVVSAGAALVLVSSAATALEGPERQCYGISMVGYDSVINSRLGVLPETVVHLAKLQQLAENEDPYAPFLLKVILDAYFWEATPHDYAVKTMYNCAVNDYRNSVGENLARTSHFEE